MKPRSYPLGICLSALLSLAGLACSAPETLMDRCDGEGLDATVSGTILEGKGQKTPPSTPFQVRAQVKSGVLIQRMKIGEAPATLESSNDNTWKVVLYEQDLEAARDAERSVAVLRVVAFDLCDEAHLIDTLEVPLGPAPGKAATGLSIDVLLSPAEECSLPADLSVTALVRVRASAESAGATVALSATQGKFTGGQANGSSTSLALQAAGGEASAEAYFLPVSAGTALFTASAKGALAEPKAIPVVAAPEVDAPSAPLVRDLSYSVAFRSRGNLEQCVLTETATGASEVLVKKPNLGALTSAVDVLEEPRSCAAPETVQMAVRFHADAPDGAATTIRCFDTFGQQAKATLSVEKKPAP